MHLATTGPFDYVLVINLGPFIAYLSKEQDFFEQEGNFNALDRTRFPFTEGYLAAISTFQFDWSFV